MHVAEFARSRTRLMQAFIQWYNDQHNADRKRDKSDPEARTRPYRDDSEKYPKHLSPSEWIQRFREFEDSQDA